MRFFHQTLANGANASGGYSASLCGYAAQRGKDRIQMPDPLRHQLASALRRTVHYLDLLPPTAAAEVREALAAYDLAVAREAIVQRPRVHQNCATCACPDDGESDE